jgi:hypothetical protein
MATSGWRAFLTRASRFWLSDPDVAAALPPAAVAAGWLGFPGATEARLAAAEARLGMPLPPSYRAFLAVSDGWLVAGAFVERLLPVAEVDWFRARHRGWIDAYLGPWSGEPLPPELAYLPHFPHTLQISAVGDGAVYLLNPRGGARRRVGGLVLRQLAARRRALPVLPGADAHDLPAGPRQPLARRRGPGTFGSCCPPCHAVMPSPWLDSWDALQHDGPSWARPG